MLNYYPKFLCEMKSVTPSLFLSISQNTKYNLIEKNDFVFIKSILRTLKFVIGD